MMEAPEKNVPEEARSLRMGKLLQERSRSSKQLRVASSVIIAGLCDAFTGLFGQSANLEANRTLKNIYPLLARSSGRRPSNATIRTHTSIKLFLALVTNLLFHITFFIHQTQPYDLTTLHIPSSQALFDTPHYTFITSHTHRTSWLPLSVSTWVPPTLV